MIIEFYRFEKEPYFKFDDGNIKISKVNGGQNKGKIQVWFKSDQSSSAKFLGGIEYYKLSMLSGCFKLLDTKYEKEPEIREIEPVEKFRKVHSGTRDYIIRNMLELFDYDNVTIISRCRKLSKEYGEILQNISNSTGSKNLGDIMDKLQETKKKFIEDEAIEFDIWELRKVTQKYNL